MNRLHHSALLALGMAALGQGAMAQSEVDALRLATQRQGGTARSIGMGNAFGALGADPAALGINPAGFGLYRASGLSLTMGLEFHSDDALYYGQRTKELQERFALSNAALVLHKPGEQEGRQSAFGVVYDRVQSQHHSTNALGPAVPSTILQAFADQAFGIPYSSLRDQLPFTSDLAWYTLGIDTVPGTVDVYEPLIPFGALTQQRRTVEAHGATTRTGIFYAGNFDERFYLGGALNILGHRFNRTTSHTENSLDANYDLAGVTYKERLVTTGNAFELSLGALYRPSERVRVGAAYFSPQWWQLNDAYVHEMRTRFRTPDAQGAYDYSAQSPDGTFAYRVRAPWRLTASAAYIAGARGLVSLDYEYQDLRRMRFRAASDLQDLYDFERENAAMRQRFVALHTVRVGTEWRLGHWYLRGGFGFVPDAYAKGDAEAGQALRSFALGAGYRGEHLTFDLGLERWLQGLRTYFYDAALVESAVIDRSGFRSLFTIALRP
jgi:hypothetical protein